MMCPHIQQSLYLELPGHKSAIPFANSFLGETVFHLLHLPFIRQNKQCSCSALVRQLYHHTGEILVVVNVGGALTLHHVDSNRHICVHKKIILKCTQRIERLFPGS